MIPLKINTWYTDIYRLMIK